VIYIIFNIFLSLLYRFMMYTSAWTQVVLLSILVYQAFGHGQLSIPRVRSMDLPSGQQWTRWMPISSASQSAFLCRNRPASSQKTTLVAGESFSVRWDMQAPHVGPCYIYIGSGNTFYQIWRHPDCRSLNHQTFSVELPKEVPSCSNCVM
jgi:hypothetical protein